MGLNEMSECNTARNGSACENDSTSTGTSCTHFEFFKRSAFSDTGIAKSWLFAGSLARGAVERFASHDCFHKRRWNHMT